MQVHTIIAGATGEEITFTSVHNRIDYADAGFAILPGKGWSGLATNVALPSLVDYTAEGGLIYAGARGGKSWEHVVVDGLTNSLFAGLGKAVDIKVNSKIKSIKKNELLSIKYQTLLDAYDLEFGNNFYKRKPTVDELKTARSGASSASLDDYNMLISPLVNLTLNWGPDYWANPIKYDLDRNKTYSVYDLPVIDFLAPPKYDAWNPFRNDDLPEVTIPYRLPENN